MGDITQLLTEMRNGSGQATSAVITQVYAELHRLAASYMRRERTDHTLQTTALVHEAYLRLVDQRNVNWQNRAQLLGVAAQCMRRVLMDHARAHLAAKRGGLQRKVSLDQVDLSPRSQAAELLALDQALSRLVSMDPRQCRIVELRFFGGLSVEDTAQVLGVSTRTVKREWMIARAWLHGQMAVRE
jgi:RNA polymerase sigma-70 factor, ECF subfamily